MKMENYVWIGVGILLVFILGAIAFSARGVVPQTNPPLSESGARAIAEKSCIKGGEALGEGVYNENSKTWWFDANLNSVKEGCNPACVVSEETKVAEINWRCTGLIEPTCICPEGYRKEGEACNPECYYNNPPCLAPSKKCTPSGEKPIPVEPDGGIGTTPPCTEDAKICPDGTSVGRDPNNNCEFRECSDERPIPVESDGGIGLTNPYVQYVGNSRAQCAATDWICIEGSSQFFDDTGCGCKADEPKKYISKDIEECSRIRYMCENNYIPFSDEDGCGCEFRFPEEEAPTGKLKAIECTPEQRKIDYCTEEYSPVCGWSDPAKIQCIRYPCAQTYGNACGACKDENVAYYTLGECPTEGGELR